MSVFLTSTGFKPKSYSEIRGEIEADFLNVFGPDIDLAPEGPFGMIIAILAKRDTDLWEGATEIYTSRDPDTSTGVALDEICAENGITRLPPTAAWVGGVILWLNTEAAYTVPAGSKAKNNANPRTYSLESDVVGSALSTGPFDALRLHLVSGFARGQTATVTVGTASYALEYNTGHADIKAYLSAFASGASVAIPAATFAYESYAGVEYLRIDQGTPLTLTASTLFDMATSLQGQKGTFTADDLGEASIVAYYLDSVVTPVTGWLDVEQPAAGTAGTNTETDTSLRLRRLRGMRSGTATEDAIREAIYRVDGVSLALVTSNRTSAFDADARPPKSFECVVQGGDKQAIANAIWTTAPAGIEIYGGFTGSAIPTVTGADGLPHKVNFSIPAPLYAWAEVTVVSTNPEELPPDNLFQAIRDAISTWGNENFGLGNDYIIQKLYAPVYSVEGVSSVSIRISVSTEPNGAHPYVTNNLPVTARQYLSFDPVRVEVLAP